MYIQYITEARALFLNYRLVIMQTEFCLFVVKETKGSYPFVNKTKRTCPPMVIIQYSPFVFSVMSGDGLGDFCGISAIFLMRLIQVRIPAAERPKVFSIFYDKIL